MKIFELKIICLTLFILVSTAISESSIYKYKDATGNIRYVDSIEKIPLEFRPSDLKPHELPELQYENAIAQKNVKPKVRRQNSRSVEDIERQLAEIEPANIHAISTNLDNNSNINFDNNISSPTKLEIEFSDEASKKVAAFSMLILVFSIVLMILNIAAYWILFNNAGLPGFGILIPIYNLVLMSQLAGKSGWWVLWLFLPFLGAIIWSFSIGYLTAKAHGRGDLFAICNIFFPFICVPIMAFSDNN